MPEKRFGTCSVCGRHNCFTTLIIGNDNGRIVIRAKVHGPKRMMHAIAEEIRRFGVANQAIVICHCLNEEIAQKLKELLAEVFSGVRIEILPTLGLTSFYAERKGLIIAY